MRRCFIHIGNFKTGSTSLQSFLYLNRTALKRIKFELINERNYFKNTIHNQYLYKYFEKKNFKKIKNYFSKVKTKTDLIISSEFFSCFSYDTEKIQYLKKTISKLGFRPIIIFYYRSDKSYLYSLYAQQMTQRKKIDLDNVFEFKNKIEKHHYYVNKKNKYYFMSQKYNLNNKKIIKNCIKVFKKDFFYIYFNKDNNEKLFLDFLKILGIKNVFDFEFPTKKNITRRIKFWNFKRIFYYMYLNYYQDKIFKKDELKIE